MLQAVPVDDDALDLAGFVAAQDDGATYETAMAELRGGHKRSHWMWFVFPQVAGLGHSAMARRYAIAGLEHARAYLAHPVLGPRLVEGARVLLELPHGDPIAVLGPIDALKLRSSMTLFAAAAGSAQAGSAQGDQTSVFADVLTRYFDGEADPATSSRL